MPNVRDAIMRSHNRLTHRLASNGSSKKGPKQPDRNWTPKAYKEREIPIPAKLVKKLKAWEAKSDKTCRLVFPTSGCNPKLDFLDCLKACAQRAKLD